MWWRARMLGGRTNHWGRISFASVQKILKEEALMGLVMTGRSAMMMSNPIMIRSMNFIGVFGTNEGLENDP